MKKSLVILFVVIALLVGAGIGWAVRGTQAGSPSAAQPSGGGSAASQSSDTTKLSACDAESLTASIAASPGGGAAGNRYYDLTITNSKTASCTVDGYPGVSLLDATGATVGKPADKDTSRQPASFTLGAGKKATATVKIAESGNYPDGTCTEGVTTIKIYPPNATGYLSVPSDTITTWCPGFTTTAFALD